MLVVCERWVGDGDRLPLIDPKFFWPLQHFFRILAGLLNRGSLRAQAVCLELVLTPLASYIQLQLELTHAVCGTWLYNCLTVTCFRLFTQVHLLIDGSVVGQYVTPSNIKSGLYQAKRYEKKYFIKNSRNLTLLPKSH